VMKLPNIVSKLGKAYTPKHERALRTLWGSMLERAPLDSMAFYSDAHFVACELAEEFETTVARTSLVLASTSHATDPARNLTLARAYLSDGMRGLQDAGAMAVHRLACQSAEHYAEREFARPWQELTTELAEAIADDIARLPGHGPKTAAFGLAIAGADILVVDRWTAKHVCGYSRPNSAGNGPYREAFKRWALDSLGSIREAQAALWHVERSEGSRAKRAAFYGGSHV
jgi:hypothetical protein